MERLTNDNGELIKCKDSFCAAICARHKTCDDCPVAQAFNRLAEYERIGLTPDQIREVDRLYLEKCREVNQLKGVSE